MGTTPILSYGRDMMNSLHQVDLRFLIHPQKLAFWINMYNICIMHVKCIVAITIDHCFRPFDECY